MTFRETAIPGALLIEPQLREDERGFFARTWCEEEFAERGLNPRLVQTSVSFNARRGTLRGLHYQVPPHAEAKLVRCTRGAAFDVVADLRPDSPTFGGWAAVRLTAENHLAHYVPEGCAHGFQALEDGTELLYYASAAYEPGAARGIRWDDPAFAIDWPLPDPILSARDARWPDFA